MQAADENTGQRPRRGHVPTAYQVGERSLALLRAIDETIDCLTNDCEVLRSVANMAHESIEDISARDERSPFPNLEKTLEALEECQDTLRHLLNSYNEKRTAAVRDKALCDDDGVVEAFDQVMDDAKLAYEGLFELLDVVQISAAHGEPRTGPFESVDSLMESLFR